MSIRRTTPAQALAGVLTAELVAGRARLLLGAYADQVPAMLEELAAKPCARPGCGHPLEAHGAPRGPLAAFRRQTCTVVPGLTLPNLCQCSEFRHA